MNTFEPIDRQPYRAEITDQGTNKTKAGVPVVKIYCRILGKPGPTDPDKLVDAIPAGNRPEVEVPTFLDESSSNCGFRVRDLVENLGWDPEEGLEAFDPKTEGYLNLVGKRLTIAPAVKSDGKVFWNFCRAERKIKRFVGDLSVEDAKSKNSGILAAYQALQTKKNDGVPQGEPVPF
jgi:hypothetical protein